jgi:FdhE protein
LFSSADKISPEVREALEQLDRLADERPSLSQPIAVLRELLPLLFASPPKDCGVQIEHDAAQERLSSGKPLLRGESLAINVRDFEQRWRSICRVLQRHRSDTAASQLAALVGRDNWRAAELLRLVLDGNTADIRALADAADVERQLALSVIRFTLLPVLSGIRASLAPLHAATNWSHGFCSTCGSWPLLAEYRGLEQTRYLRCGLCVGEWEFPRLQCPYCENRDHRQLGYFHAEGQQDRFRVATCDACRGYVKTVSTLGALSGPQLLVMDLATMHLDLAAADRGFMSG